MFKSEHQDKGLYAAGPWSPFKRTRGENLADVITRGVGLATEVGQEVSSNNLHFSAILIRMVPERNLSLWP